MRKVYFKPETLIEMVDEEMIIAMSTGFDPNSEPNPGQDPNDPNPEAPESMWD